MLKFKLLVYTIGLLIWVTFINLIEENKPEVKESDFDRLFRESQEIEPDNFIEEFLIDYDLCIDN